MTLWRRIFVEKRAAIIPLALGIVGNLLAYALWVYPLGVKQAGAVDRAEAAARSLKAAEADFNAAKALVTGKARAEEALSTFFDKVLPADMGSALRLTYTTLPEMARKANVRFLGRKIDTEPPKKDSRLGVLKTHTQWTCDYDSFRRFIFDVESAPAFVIIDEVAIAQQDPAKPLAVTLSLSTYYRLGANGN
jgi:hypothetical protein